MDAQAITRATAPGKLVLCGEYAVLEGAPALLMAMDARACVSLKDSHDGAMRVTAPGLRVTDARFEFDANGKVRWRDLDDAQRPRLALAARIIGRFGAGRTPFHASLDTEDFHRNGEKLGLGSSAALTVALAGALRARAQREPPGLEELIALHCEWQGGGSGLDIAASFTGGFSIYRRGDGVPSVEHAQWPAALHWCCIWLGQPAETGSQLQRLQQWRER